MPKIVLYHRGVNGLLSRLHRVLCAAVSGDIIFGLTIVALEAPEGIHGPCGPESRTKERVLRYRDTLYIVQN